MQKLKEICQALRRPEPFFEERGGDVAKWIGPVSLLLGLVTLALVLTRLVGPVDPLAYEALDEATAHVALIMRNPTPAERLLFPLYWAALISYGWLTRYIAVMVFGETNRRAGDALLVTMIGTLPLLFMSGVLGVLNQLAPYWLHRPDSALLSLRLAANLAFFGCAFLWEARIVVAGFRTLFGQNRGRAIATWLMPSVGLLFCATPAVVFLLVSLR